VYITKFTFWL
jgi:hypothetical protein